MHSEPIGPETLAALLDGTLPENQRERVLAELAKGGESYENLLEVLAMQGELSEDKKSGLEPSPAQRSDGRAQVLPLKRVTPRRWASRRMWATAALPIAAGIVAIVVMQRATGGAVPSLMAARGLSGEALTITQSLGSSWHEPRWSGVRGGAETLEPRVRAFRGGARFADLEVGVAANDSAAVTTIVRGLSQLASGMDAGTLVAARIDQMAGNRATRQERNKLAQDFRQLFASPEWFDLGAWTEAARLAAAARQVSFFAANGDEMRGLRRSLDALEQQGAITQPDVHSTLDKLRQLSGTVVTSPDQLASIGATLDSTIAGAGR